MRHFLPFLLLSCLASWGLARPGHAQAPAGLDLLCDEHFNPPPAGHFWTGRDESLVAEMGPQGYTMRFVADHNIFLNRSTNPLGPSLNQEGDFVLEAEVRGQGSVGLYWGGASFKDGNEFDVLQLDLGLNPAGYSVWRRRPGAWTKLGSGALPGPDAADWHTLRVARTGSAVDYWLDGTRVLQQPWTTPAGRELGLTLQNSGAEITMRRLRVWHEHHIRLAPDLPAGLQRERLTTGGINTEREENCPLVSADGQWLFFSRVMGDVKQVDNAASYNADCYVSERQADGSWGPVRALGYPINNETSNYPQGVSPDGQSLLLGGLYKADGKPGGMGYARSQRQVDGSWTIPANLTTPADDQHQPAFGTRNQTASLDASGSVLVHSAVLAANLNNTDLYVRRRLPDGSWSPSVPLPANINTPGGNESTPFLAPDGKTLYFASDGLPGYGGFDVFVTRRLDDTWTRWSEPLNLGPGVNTVSSELYFSVPANGEYAYFISSEQAEQLDDIYRLKLPPSLRANPTRLVRGRVLDARTGLAVPGAQVRYEQLPDGQHAGQVAAEAGTFEIVLPTGRQYGFRAEAAGYVAASDHLDLTAATTGGEARRDLYLLPVIADVARLEALQLKPAADTSLYASLRLKPTPKPQGSLPGTLASLQLDTPAAGTTATAKEEARLVLNNVFFEQGKPVLLPASFPELKRLAATLRENPAVRIRLEGHTDNQGPADKNQVLSEQRVAEIKKYLIRQQVAADRLETVGYGATRPVAPNDVEANRRRNRRVEFVILSR